jgi:hypothetical protein
MRLEGTKSRDCEVYIIDALKLTEHAPDMDGKRILTTHRTVMSVYTEYKEERESQGYEKDRIAGWSLFHKMWQKVTRNEHGEKEFYIGSVRTVCTFL